jgi:hypothetical protein
MQAFSAGAVISTVGLVALGGLAAAPFVALAAGAEDTAAWLYAQLHPEYFPQVAQTVEQTLSGGSTAEVVSAEQLALDENTLGKGYYGGGSSEFMGGRPEDYPPDKYPKFEDLLDPSHPSNPANGQARDAGHHYASEVLSGGTGQAIAGHGDYSVSQYGTFVVPEGTWVRRWWSDQTEIYDDQARLIEAGQYSRAMNSVYGMWVDPVIHEPGTVMPNYMVDIPNEGLSIYENSITVGNPTPLSELLGPNMGCIDLAFCTRHRP